MLSHPEMLLPAARAAGITPLPETKEELDHLAEPGVREKYVRFVIFCIMQLGKPMPTPYAHWDNAKVIASIPEDKLKRITFKEVAAMGFQTGNSSLMA